MHNGRGRVGYSLSICANKLLGCNVTAHDLIVTLQGICSLCFWGRAFLRHACCRCMAVNSRPSLLLGFNSLLRALGWIWTLVEPSLAGICGSTVLWIELDLFLSSFAAFRVLEKSTCSVFSVWVLQTIDGPKTRVLFIVSRRTVRDRVCLCSFLNGILATMSCAGLSTLEVGRTSRCDLTVKLSVLQSSVRRAVTYA
jgi:hypothetical protein